MRELDVTLFRAINGSSDAFAPVMLFFSEGNKQTIVRIALLILFVALVWSKRQRKPALLAMVAWPIANAACDWLKFGLQHRRPNVELADVVLRVGNMTTFGTASAHAATMMSVATVFLFYNRTAGFVWLAVALLTGVSRVYVGVHYPSQVMFGWAVGAFVAFVAVKTWQARERLVASRQAPAGASLVEDQ